MNYWPSTPKKTPDRTLREFRGVNKLDPFSISDEYATDMSNLTSDKYPAFTTRPGFSMVGDVRPWTTKILGLGLWKNSELHATSTGSWYRFAGGSWGSLASGLNNQSEWSFANFDGSFPDIHLIGANGVDPLKVYNGSTVTNLSGAPAGGSFIINYMNRLFCAVGNLVRASGLNLATDWTSAAGNDTDSYSISVDTTDGETVNGLKPGIGHVTIFKPNSMHELFGADPSNVRIEPITFEVGAINNKCVVTLNGVMYIIHRTGIYRYAGGTRPNRDFSQPVQWYIDNMNAEGRLTSCCGTDGQKLYFSIPMASTVSPDTILVYDPKFDMWCVWKGFMALHMAQSASDIFMGANDTKVIKLGGSTDAGLPITWERISKPFGAEQLSRKIRWTRTWVVCDVPSGSTLNVHVSPSPTGSNDWISAGSITPQTGVQSSRIIFSPTQLANSNYLRVKFSGTGPVTVHEWDRDQIEFPIV